MTQSVMVSDVAAAGVPVFDSDIYSTEAILDPYPHYRRLRDLGPLVWLPRQKVYALPRYAECKAALEEADYPAFRVRVTAEIGPWAGTAVWDVSTGDPMVPPPRLVTLARILGNKQSEGKQSKTPAQSSFTMSG